jgi:uncharacterized protein YjaG (DUF416 family)
MVFLDRGSYYVSFRLSIGLHSISVRTYATRTQASLKLEDQIGKLQKVLYGYNAFADSSHRLAIKIRRDSCNTISTIAHRLKHRKTSDLESTISVFSIVVVGHNGREGLKRGMFQNRRKVLHNYRVTNHNSTSKQTAG